MVTITPRKVKKQVGMNPIARAVARENLRKSITDQKIQLYFLNDGVECINIIAPIFLLMKAFVLAASRDKKVGVDSREVRILKGAISACEQMMANNVYHQVNTTTLDVALDCAAGLSKAVDPVLFNSAWHEVCG
tara:strand:- start:545 stop:946 length:402 start_codon:yes stop_codon:yes gene_type:complete